MNRFRTIGTAVMFAGISAIGMASTATVSADDGSFHVSTSVICQALEASEAAANRLPDSYSFKQALLQYLDAQEAKFGCQS